MKYTLLDMTQSILSSLDSDEVNSIGDTVESRQVAEIIKTTYFNILTRANLHEHFKIFSLDASTEDEQPVLMYRPSNVSKIEWIKYNVATVDAPEQNFSYVTILPVDQFLDLVHQYNETESDVSTFTVDDFQFNFKNNTHPTYCTIVRDYLIIFDSYDSSVEDTLQESKTLCYGKVTPTFTMEDTFVPELDSEQFPLLLNEAKSLAFVELKQMTHEKAELESRRQWRNLQKSKSLHSLSELDQLPHFGRKTNLRSYRGFNRVRI